MTLIRALLLVLVAAPALALSPGELGRFAAGLGLRDAAGFAETVAELRAHGRLPARYLTKAEAERHGWSPGKNICAVLPGRAIGGDAFRNAERLLPEARGRRWHEADLDTPCGGSRGPKRLVYSSDGLQYVTIDHYKSFTRVPE